MKWCAPPETLRLRDDETHVWRVSLDQPAYRIQALYPTLADEERERASHFHTRTDRERFLVRHGLLRAILGRYVHSDPAQLRFCYGPHGKPALSPESTTAPLRFNLAHTNGVALYAITSGRELGVDIEYISADLTEEDIAKQFFSQPETDVLRSLTGQKRKDAFFTCWTRKEAYLKARGKELTLALHQFAVSLLPGAPAVLTYLQGDPREAARWSLQDLHPGPGYKAALAVEGVVGRLRCWQWPE